MDVITLEAQPRNTGKGAARATRRAGNVPCILYGHGRSPIAFQVQELQLMQLAFSREKKRVRLTVDKEKIDCILKQIDLHPVSDRPIHADFQELKRGELVTLTIPVRFLGTPVGQSSEGGDTQYPLHEVTVSCLPENIPSHIDIDVANLRIGDSLHIRDLQIPGVEIQDSPDKTVVTVLAPRLHIPELEEEKAPGELEAEAEELTEPEDTEE